MKIMASTGPGAALGFLLLGLPTGLLSQNLPECDSSTGGCIITMQRVATLDPPEDGGVFTTFSQVLRLPDGRYLVANEAQPGEIELYSEEGQYLTTIGGHGEGPGEYTYIREMLLADGDSIIVTDVNTGRLSVLDPSLSFARSARLPYRHRELHLVRGGYVLNGQVRTPESVGLPLHYIDAEGQLRLSFGVDTAIYRPDFAGLNSRPLTTDGAGDVWAGYAGQYVIDRFDLSGRRRSRIIRDADWFPAWTVHPPLSVVEPPLPQLTRLQLTDGAVLWALVLVASPDFAEAFELPPDAPGPARLRNYYDLYHAVLEAIDPRSGQVLASRPFPGFLFVFADERHVVGYREESDLLPRLDVWRLSLQPADHNDDVSHRP